MSGIGTGYDLSASTYSPDGRIFQVEYALKAVDNSGFVSCLRGVCGMVVGPVKKLTQNGKIDTRNHCKTFKRKRRTAIGIRAKNGVVLAVEKLVASPLLVPGSNKRIQSIDPHIGFASAGLLSDSRALVNRARQEAREYRDLYRDPIPGKVLSERVAQYVQAYTLYSSVRPFGISGIIGAVDRNGPGLWCVEPSGIFYGYYGVAVGKGRQVAKTEIEKFKFDELDIEDAVKEAARIIHMVHDQAKDKDFELELSWICEKSNWKHAFVPKETFEAAEKYAKEKMDDMDED